MLANQKDDYIQQNHRRAIARVVCRWQRFRKQCLSYARFIKASRDVVRR